MVLPAVRGDYRAAETYRYAPGPPLTAPVQAHVGLDDPKVTLEEARAWETHTEGSFEMHTYPGGHFYLNTQASKVIETVSKTVSSLLAARP